MPAYTEGMATMTVNGKTIQFDKFVSLERAKSCASSQPKVWIIMGDVGQYWLVRPVDAAKLMAAGYELVRNYR